MGDGESETGRIPERRGGRLYPMDSIIAHIGDGDQAVAAETALREAGWAGDDVVAASGEEVIEVSGAAQVGRRFMQRMIAAFPSEETAIETEFKDAAVRGAWAIMVRTESDDQRATAASNLQAHGAYGLRHYGKRVITDL